MKDFFARRSYKILDNIQIFIPKIPKDILIKNAKQSFYQRTGKIFIEYSESNLQRICVNYLRHRYTPYDLLVKAYERSREHKTNFVIDIYSKIGADYPWLYDECIRQLQLRLDPARGIL